jgi:hypothetical protein
MKQALMDKLPLEIILFHIIPYTYNVQSKALLEDIKSYVQIKHILNMLYYKYWILSGSELEPEDKNWLLNDINIYANNDVAMMYGFVDKFYTIYKRNILLHTNNQVNNYILSLEQKDVTTQINIFLGLMLPIERIEFIENRILLWDRADIGGVNDWI